MSPWGGQPALGSRTLGRARESGRCSAGSPPEGLSPQGASREVLQSHKVGGGGRCRVLAGSRPEAGLKHLGKASLVKLSGLLTVVWLGHLGCPLLYPRHLWAPQESSGTCKEWRIAPRATRQLRVREANGRGAGGGPG